MSPLLIHPDLNVSTLGASWSPTLTFYSVSAGPETNGTTPQVSHGPNEPAGKKKRNKKDHHVAVENEVHDPDLDMATSPEASKTSVKKRKKNGTASAAESSTKSTAKRSKTSEAIPAPPPVKGRKKSALKEPSPPRKLARNKACLLCCKKKIKCNEAKPSCSQCTRGLWPCQYGAVEPKQRSKNGCLNCKQRRRKCTEQKPSCVYCLKVGHDCEYAEYS